VRAIFMGKHKRSAALALEHLVGRGCEVAAVVCPPDAGDAADEQRLDLVAERHGLRLATDDELYAEIEAAALGDIDLVLSFLFWKRIRGPLIDLASAGCLNFHPAPLPDMRGVGGFNVAILEDFPEWGVSAHFVDEQFDTGDIVRVDRFPIDRERETALSLDFRSQETLLAVYRDVVDAALDRRELPRTPQGEGRYVTSAEMEELRRIRPDDDAATVARRIRAYWYPPHDGATVEIAGKTVTLVDRQLLAETAAAYRDAGVFS
jgi:methionyl-tRNA formyltransferase